MSSENLNNILNTKDFENFEIFDNFPEDQEQLNKPVITLEPPKLPTYKNRYVNEFEEEIDDSKNSLSNKIIDLTNKHIKLDQAYRRKHNELIIMFDEYKKLHAEAEKNKDIGNVKQYRSELNNINNKIKNNTQDMYKGRLFIIGRLKEL